MDRLTTTVQHKGTVNLYTTVPSPGTTTSPKGVTMEVRLAITQTEESQREVVLTELPALIGRSLIAEFRPDDLWVSREHCEIDELGDGLVIRDLGSRHGTFVNGLRIGKTVLLPGDDITIGVTHLLVCEPNGKTRGEGSEFDDNCESQPHSEQPTAACRSDPTGPCRQDRRLRVRRTVGRMFKWCGSHVINRAKTPPPARRSVAGKASRTSGNAGPVTDDVSKEQLGKTP